MKCYRCNLWPCECRDNIALICGDNCDVMGLLPKESVDLVVTSPPYDDLRTYGGHSWDFYGVAWQLKRLLKPGGVIVWVVADSTVEGSESGTSMRQALHFREIGLRIHDTMIYAKHSANFPDATRYGQVWEYAFVMSAGPPKSFNPIQDRKNLYAGDKVHGTDRNPDGTTSRKACWGNEIPEYGARFNLWRVPNPGKANNPHPASFPESLARDHILSWSNPGDLVLDPFNGSGTTTKMAKLTGRRAIGIEVNPDYMPIQVSRLRQEVLQFTD